MKVSEENFIINYEIADIPDPYIWNVPLAKGMIPSLPLKKARDGNNDYEYKQHHPKIVESLNLYNLTLS